MTFSPQEFLEPLQLAASQLERAQALYKGEKYKEAYEVAKQVEDTVEEAYKSFIGVLKQTLTQIARSLKEEAKEEFLKEFLENTLHQIEGIRETADPEMLNQLIDLSYQLIIASKAVQAPVLEEKLRELVKQLETLRTNIEALNQTYQQLQRA